MSEMMTEHAATKVPDGTLERMNKAAAKYKWSRAQWLRELILEALEKEADDDAR